MTETDTILLETSGDVAVLTLNRPDRLNACSLAMADAITAAIADLGGARALLVTGAGRAFCSGADLQARADASVSTGEGSYRALMAHYNPMILRLSRLPMPVVAAVNGPAAGIGCSLALAADFVLAGERAYFLQAFVNIGLVPDGGASWMLPRLVGKARATEMMMLGEKIGAAQAADWGLIHKAVPDAALMDEAKALAARLAAGPTLALAAMKANLADGLDASLASALTAEAEGQRRAASTADAMEGAMAFLAKRKAEFRGH